MRLYVILPLCALLTLTEQEHQHGKCACELSNSERAFPHEKLRRAESSASACNSNITPQKTVELESLLQGLEQRLGELHKDVQILEKEDDGELYGVLSLYVIENEMTEIKLLMDKLNSTTLGHQLLTANTSQQLENMKTEMEELEKFDSMQVIKGQQTIRSLTTDLDSCKRELGVLSQLPQGTCPRSRILNVTGPVFFTAGEYPGSYPYGAWGRDPKPEKGKESWYWVVMMTSNNRYSNYVRFYSSLSTLIIGVSVPGNVEIHSSNPATNTIQGPNNVVYGGALYYNCYDRDAVCRFNLTTKSVSTIELHKDTRYNSKANFCHLDECYPYTDLDLATDESGVWVIFTTALDFGNIILSNVEEGDPPVLGKTWQTSLYKQAVTNTFMACGVLYATRYVSEEVEEIFYSFNTVTGKERFSVGIFINKVSPNIQALNYSPVDQMLYAYCDSIMVSYKMFFK
ncbi:olfactomedin-4-like [Archocentrus centrarchus]|uniref:olfactomedin-4-like n=1 Tax=Archocentrus centrarchus TaxID=63155 RepID=UPI0011EA36A0|nr:olfactomedin-4-like [Archocentrus centrarchus]